MDSFNTQPRGGGCWALGYWALGYWAFQHTAARRRLLFLLLLPLGYFSFNTQPRGGGCFTPCFYRVAKMGFNTQPRGGGCIYDLADLVGASVVSTHSRAEAAARRR